MIMGAAYLKYQFLGAHLVFNLTATAARMTAITQQL